jgi:hypothetical protein
MSTFKVLGSVFLCGLCGESWFLSAPGTASVIPVFQFFPNPRHCGQYHASTRPELRVIHSRCFQN